jgi:hypothetical protein
MSLGGQVTGSQDSKSLIYTPGNSADPIDKNGFLNTKSTYHVLYTASDKDVVLISREKNPDMNIKPEERPIFITARITNTLQHSCRPLTAE